MYFIIEEAKETILDFSQGTVKVLWNCWILEIKNGKMLKSWIKNGTEVTLRISSNIVGDSNDENNFQNKLLLTNTQIPRLRKAFANGSLANIKLSKTQLHKIRHSGGFLGRHLGPLRKSRLPLIGNALNHWLRAV